jgi:hypothetical protein
MAGDLRQSAGMNPQEIAQLQAQTEYPSVSILMPIYAASPDNRQQTPIRIKNLLRQAEERLRAEFSERDLEPLHARLQDLATNVDSEQAAHGLALFASPGFSRMYYLPFPVQERVSVNHGFATRDLVQAHVQSPRYLALSLSEKTTHLLEGVRDHLREIEDCGFPVTLEVEGVRSELPGTYGIETTRLHDREEREYFNRVQHALEAILARQNLPIALIGTTRTLAFFDEVTQHKGKPRFHVIARLTGNYEKLPRRDLEAKLWPLVEEGLHAELQQVKERYDNASTDHQACGLRYVWRAANEGRVDTLLVEEDYYQPARIRDKTLHFLADGARDGEGAPEDAVDETIAAVLNTGGNVVFFKPGELESCQRIAAILRY